MLSNIRPDKRLSDCDLRLHLVCPHVDWVKVADRDRIALIRDYLDFLSRYQTARTRDIVALPAGFQSEAAPARVCGMIERELAGYVGRRTLLSAGLDAPDGSQPSYLLDLSGDSRSCPCSSANSTTRSIPATLKTNARVFDMAWKSSPCVARTPPVPEEVSLRSPSAGQRPWPSTS